ncbi:MAG TPA: PQQ-dependent sugar dehydrogenase [Pirellulales bacterium]
MTRHFRLRISIFTLVWFALAGGSQAAAPDPKLPPLVIGLKNPESAVKAADGRMFVSVIGEFEKAGDGAVMLVTPGKAVPFATGLDDPKGLVFIGRNLYAADGQKIWRINPSGRATVFVSAAAFGRPVYSLNDLAADESGNVYVSDTGDLKGHDGAVYRIAPTGSVTLLLDNQRQPALRAPNGVLVEDGQLWVADSLAGQVGRLGLADDSWSIIARGLPAADGLVRDLDGNLYISQWTTGQIWSLPPGSDQPELLAEGYQSAADIGLDQPTGHLLVPDMKAGQLLTAALRSGVPRDVDREPLKVRVERAFEHLEFDRPIVLTHAGDGSNRVFVASQLGRVFVFPNGQGVKQSEPFFDLHQKVRYSDKENEEGFLGLAFHPHFEQNGEFFAYYTTTDAPHVSVVSRFRATGSDHAQASPDSEEELLRIPQPYWNHNGGTLAFGPDGYLYIALGDGGLADDPHGNGQNLKTLLGSVLRIDVDRRDPGLKYAIPKDNPFARRPPARPEIYAYGVRNIWRLSFDRQTGDCWAADVGQNIWEEIDLIRSGGNYGWALREGMHRFGPGGSPPRPDLIEPIWEYHHDIGKSITGGHVYRGQRVPKLAGMYLYGDYVTGRIWGLKYDPARRRVVANHPIAGNVMPIMSFGEDEQGEVYFMTTQGRLFRFASAQPK